MRLHTDEEIEFFNEITWTDMLKKETNGYLMFWNNGSCISNHGHIMMMLSWICDDGAFTTDQKYKTKHGCLQNIQSIVEKPYIFLVARCPYTARSE